MAMRDKIAAGTTSYSSPIYVTNSSTGLGLGSLVYNTSSLVGEYRRAGQSSWTSISLSAGTLGTWSSGGWIADGGLTGAYEVGAPNAALATGVPWVVIRYYGAANMAPVLIYIELDAVNYQDGVHYGLTSLPNAAASASGGLPTIGTGSGQISLASGGKISEVALVDTLTTYTGDTPQTGDSYARIGSTGSGLTSLAPSSTALSTATWTSALAGYLNLLGGTLVGSTSVFSSGALANTPGFSLSQSLSSPRALDTIADSSMTVNDAFWCAVVGAAGKQSTSGTNYTVETPYTGTVIRTFTLTLITPPTTVPSARS